MTNAEFTAKIAPEIEGRAKVTDYQLSDWYHAMRNYTVSRALDLIRGYVRSTQERVMLKDFKNYLSVQAEKNPGLDSRVPRFRVEVEPYPYAAKVRVESIKGQVAFGYLERRRDFDDLKIWRKKNGWSLCVVDAGNHCLKSITHLGEAPQEWTGHGMKCSEPVGVDDLTGGDGHGP